MQMVKAFKEKKAAINQLSSALNSNLEVIELKLDKPTLDFTKGPSMSKIEFLEAFNIGFNSVKTEETEEAEEISLLRQVRAEDLLHFGLIPEIIGRLPVLTSLRKLTEKELVQIVTEPKNALVKQYQKQLSMNNVQLKVTKDGLSEMAKQAIERGTGARALRSIFEGLMLDVMFEVPSRKDIETVTVNAAAVKGDKAPAMKKRRSNAA